MAKKKKVINPFYVVLVIAGIAFSITAVAFGTLMVRTNHLGAARLDLDESPVLSFMDSHGMTLLIAELVLLGVASLAAMATDSYWTARAEAGSANASPEATRTAPGEEDLP